MRFLTQTESLRLLQELPKTSDGTSAELRIATEKCMQCSFASARLFAKMIGVGPSFLWITEFGIWPSFENRHLFSSLRRAENEFRSIHEAPGHLFAADEQDILISYLQLAIISGWGGVLLGFENQRRLIISHDSWMSFHLMSDVTTSDAESLVKALDDFGLPYRVSEQPNDTFAALGLTRDGERRTYDG